MKRNRGKIEAIYKNIHSCHKCFNDNKCKMVYDKKKVLRKIVLKALRSDIFIIGQSLGAETQRISGLPYTFTFGDLSPTGQTLDLFLRSFGYTIDSSHDFDNLKYVYSTDIVQCYPEPGKRERNERAEPTTKEMENCSIWIDKELKIVEPIIIIILGKLATKTFLKKYFKLTIRSMRDVWGKKYQLEEKGECMYVFAIPHPAYRSRNSEKVDQIYDKTATRIRKIIT